MPNLNELPPDLPVPQDDGACAHLPGKTLPALELASTQGRRVDVRAAAASPTVFFFYPRTGRPDSPVPPEWDKIPGARGCTPQNCGFRDHLAEFQARKVQVFGMSSQPTDYQLEFAKRNEIPYEILSDEKFELTDALGLPTFEFQSTRLIKRLAIYAEEGRILKVFYPVFPPNQNAQEVLDWLDQ